MTVPEASDSRRTGTRFKVFPQAPYVAPFNEPETVWVSPPAGTVGPGPADDCMYVIDPVGKTQPYGTPLRSRGSSIPYLPPWNGEVHPPAMPDPEGHFDHLEPGTAEFEAAHVYATVRYVLDIWEHYFGRRIEWHFRHHYDRLELVLLRHLDNALMGYGFMEVGYHREPSGGVRPFTLNFDVLAHEVGHSIIYSVIGVPTGGTERGEYFGFHESAADSVALLSALHFDSVVDQLLRNTSGNLYTLNRLNRIGELTENTQLRLAANASRLSDFKAGWSDEHNLSEPLTGAMFDILVDIFHEALLDRGLISPQVEDLADRVEQQPEYADLIQDLFDGAYAENHAGFKDALLATRDILGYYLAETWSRLSPDYLDYDKVGATILEVDLEATGGCYERAIARNLRLRDIGLVRVGPRRAPPTTRSHAVSARTLLPESRLPSKKMSYSERMAAARRGTMPLS